MKDEELFTTASPMWEMIEKEFGNDQRYHVEISISDNLKDGEAVGLIHGEVGTKFKTTDMMALTSNALTVIEAYMNKEAINEG